MPVYLIETGCFKPPDELRVDVDEMEKHPEKLAKMFAHTGASMEEIMHNVEFQRRVFAKSGISRNLTYSPRSLHPILTEGNPKTDEESAYEECTMAVGGAVEELLQKTGLQPDEVDILVTSCGVYNPTPSVASMLINKFKMRQDIQSYHLGGMGCANGVLAINLVNDLLVANPGCNAIMVTSETLTPAYYRGMDTHRLIGNTLFRMGAAAVLLSNKEKWRFSGGAKYVLQRKVRVHRACVDEAYRAIWYGPDSDGHVGTYLGTNVFAEASKALTSAMKQIGPYALSWREIGRVAVNYLERKMKVDVPRYRPSFSDGIQKFLIHAGGPKVLDGIAAALHSEESHMVPSRAVLHDYGNISSSTTWYELAYVESFEGVKRGDRILQIGVGSGIKCGVIIWKALRDVKEMHTVWKHRVTEKPHQAVNEEVTTTAAVDNASAWKKLCSSVKNVSCMNASSCGTKTDHGASVQITAP